MRWPIVAENSKKPRGKPFPKGRTGNPGGRPKKTPEELSLIDACKAKTPNALEVIERIMLTSDNERNQLQAALAIIERAWGKPVQPTETALSGTVHHEHGKRPKLTRDEWLKLNGIAE